MVDPAMANLYQPDVIIVAMGTNDYSGNRDKSVEWFRNRMDAFLDKVEQVYPNVPIIGITPIRRLLSMDETVNPENNYDKNCVERANKGYALGIQDHGGFVVDGEIILSKVSDYADEIHPNETGFIEYGETLCFLIEDEIARIVAAKNKK
jgi:lysophospholipase L1-like esterase